MTPEVGAPGRQVPVLASPMSTSQELTLVTGFLTSIGLPWRWHPGAHGFCPGIDIVDGVLLIAPDARASAALHEAGHLATLPGEFRPYAQRNVSGVQRLVCEHVDFAQDPDGELQRAAIQCSDPEATAWAWAAGQHLGLPPRSIIQDDEYDGDGAFVRLQLATRGYLGINGLAHAGFCAQRPNAYAKARGLPAFPELRFWLQRNFGTAIVGSTSRHGAGLAEAGVHRSAPRGRRQMNAASANVQ